MARPFSGAGEGGAADYEGAFGWEDVEECVVGGIEDLCPEEVVVVVFLGPAVVGGVWTDCVDVKGTLNVVDDIWRVLDRSGSRSWRCSEICGRSSWSWDSSCRCSRSLTGGSGRSRGEFRSIGVVESFRIAVNDVPRFARETEWWMDRVESEVLAATGANAERRHFAHVDPDAIE